MSGLFEDEPIADCETPEQMRAELFKRSYVGQGTLVRHAMTMADMQGLSGEDRYVVLAYYLLRENADLKERLLRVAETTIPPMFIRKETDE